MSKFEPKKSVFVLVLALLPLQVLLDTASTLETELLTDTFQSCSPELALRARM